MISVEDFKPVEFEDYEVFKRCYEKNPPLHSDYLWSLQMCWKHYMKYNYVEHNGQIVFMTEKDGQRYVRPPTGPANKELLDDVLRIADEIDSPVHLNLADQYMREWTKKEHPELSYELHRDYYDYLYLAKDLANLPGKAYLKIRNDLNYFKKHYNFQVEPVTEQNIIEFQEMLQRWCKARDCSDVPLMEKEKIATETALYNFDKLHLEGIGLRIEGSIQAFSVWDWISPDTVVIHYEKAMQEYRGIYQAINQEAAKLLAPKYKYINRESDMGEPGLRKAKEKYHPHHMVEVGHAPRT